MAKRRRLKKRVLITICVVFFFIIYGGAFYFGMYLDNKDKPKVEVTEEKGWRE